MLAKLIPVLCALALGGCAAVQSERYDPRDTSEVRTGMHYALPKALFHIGLMERGNTLIVLVSEPIYVGDPTAAYMLEAGDNVLANQQFTIQVHPETRLLNTVNVVSRGQADEVLRNLVRAASGASALTAEENAAIARRQRVIYSRVVDPFMQPGCDFGSECSLSQIASEMRDAAIENFHCRRAETRSDLCPTMLQDPQFFSLRLTPLFAGAPVPASQTADMAQACSVSICYRTPAPYMVSLRVRGVVDVAEVVALPNEAPVSRLVAPAGVFADATTRIELRNGMPGHYVIDHGSEIVAATALPFTLVREAFNTVSEVFEFRIDYSNDRRRLAQAERERVETEQQPQRERPTDPAGLPSDETGLEQNAATFRAAPSNGVPAKPLFEVPLGQEVEPAQMPGDND